MCISAVSLPVYPPVTFSKRWRQDKYSCTVAAQLTFESLVLTLWTTSFNTKQNKQRNIEVRSRNYYFSGEATSITLYERMFVAICLKHAMRMRHIAICDLKPYIPSKQCFVWASA
jgi:hypothetical protein